MAKETSKRFVMTTEDTAKGKQNATSAKAVKSVQRELGTTGRTNKKREAKK